MLISNDYELDRVEKQYYNWLEANFQVFLPFQGIGRLFVQVLLPIGGIPFTQLPVF